MFSYSTFFFNLVAKNGKLGKFTTIHPSTTVCINLLTLKVEKKGSVENSIFRIPYYITVTSKKLYGNKLRTCLGVITCVSLYNDSRIDGHLLSSWHFNPLATLNSPTLFVSSPHQFRSELTLIRLEYKIYPLALNILQFIFSTSSSSASPSPDQCVTPLKSRRLFIFIKNKTSFLIQLIPIGRVYSICTIIVIPMLL